MRAFLFFFVLVLVGFAQTEQPKTVIVDYTNYNVGDEVRARLAATGDGTIDIRYAGETAPLVQSVPIAPIEYKKIWNIPLTARTGRYEVDFRSQDGSVFRNAGWFGVHRQLAKVLSIDLDKTFYTSGDSVNPTIVVRNVSAQPIKNLQIEFEPYTFPWIAPSPDEPPMWKRIVATGLALGPREEKKFYVDRAAVVQAEKEPVAIYYSVVIRDTARQSRIYDLAFALPAFTVPSNTPSPKQYPFLYLYWHLRDLPKSEAYRNFYPPEYVSDSIQFDTGHTMFPTGQAPRISFSVSKLPGNVSLSIQVLDAAGKQLESHPIAGASDGHHQVDLQARSPGLYRLQVLLRDDAGTIAAQNQIEFAVNNMPKSILVFCAHQDDDTAHPGLIRAAVENHIPIHFVYFTSGDAGGCERFYMHSCDAARAMDFGEVRMNESRASLEHLGVAPENLFFLGLPDGGMEEIWLHHPHVSDPYLSVLLASEHSPYRDSAIPNLSYSRDAVIDAAKQFIQRFQPDMILTGHPDERHVDHRTNNWIVVNAMQQLLQSGTISRDTKLVVDVAYGAKPGRHAPYRYSPEPLFVSGEAAKLGQEATWYYQSQDGNHQQANVIDFIHLPRKEPYPHLRVLDWFEYAGWNNEPESVQ